MRNATRAPEPPWVVTLFAPPALRVTAQEYSQQQLPPLYRIVALQTVRTPLAARVLACRRAWARHGWRPYDRSDRFCWSDGDLTIHAPEEEG